MHSTDSKRGPAGVRGSSPRLWQAIALLGLDLGAAGIIVGLTSGESAETARAATRTTGAVPDYGPERALMKDINHAGDAHDATADTPVERYERPDPTLPAVPAGKVKRFSIDVAERVTRVSAEKPPVRVWSYAVDGRILSGTGGSPPIVVDQGDTVEIELTNGSSEEMQVHFPHSFDTHASEVSPREAYRDVDPGKTLRFRFVARHPGVFMYHCGTKPVLRHFGAGMAGMMVVKPRGLAAVSLGPAEGGFVELTLDREGTFPFVTHAFGDMVRGAIGALKTERAAASPEPAADEAHEDMAGEGDGHDDETGH